MHGIGLVVGLGDHGQGRGSMGGHWLRRCGGRRGEYRRELRRLRRIGVGVRVRVRVRVVGLVLINSWIVIAVSPWCWPRHNGQDREGVLEVMVGYRRMSRGVRMGVLGVHRTSAGAGLAIHRSRGRSSWALITDYFPGWARWQGEDQRRMDGGGKNAEDEKLNGQRTAPIRKSP